MQCFCPLCSGEAHAFYKGKKQHYLQCEKCSGIFLHPDLRLTPEAEKTRYLHHNNDINDTGYQQFLQPVVDAIEKNYSPESKGLDYGAGPGPVVAFMLEQKGFSLALFDPFFHPSKEVLASKYDFITCTEVIEHFYNPLQEFKKLYEMLHPDGKLFCMTNIYREEINFAGWNYKNDQTHVFIYTAKTLAFISEIIGFKEIIINERLITFSKG
jgi:hypothetical protein